MTFTKFLSLLNTLAVVLLRPQVRVYTLLILMVTGFSLALTGFLLQSEPVSRHLAGDGTFQHLVSRMHDLLKDTLYVDHRINLDH